MNSESASERGFPHQPCTHRTKPDMFDRRIARYHVMDTSLERVVDDLSRQTGQPIKVEWDSLHLGEGSPRQVKVTIDLDNVTLYSALQAVFATMEPVHYGVNQGVITLSAPATEMGGRRPHL